MSERTFNQLIGYGLKILGILLFILITMIEKADNIFVKSAKTYGYALSIALIFIGLYHAF